MILFFFFINKPRIDETRGLRSLVSAISELLVSQFSIANNYNVVLVGLETLRAFPYRAGYNGILGRNPCKRPCGGFALETLFREQQKIPKLDAFSVFFFPLLSNAEGVQEREADAEAPQLDPLCVEEQQLRPQPSASLASSSQACLISDLPGSWRMNQRGRVLFVLFNLFLKRPRL